LKRNSFGRKLWSCFALFAAVIFAALWCLQTVFLQTFYDRMTIRNVEKAAAEIAAAQEDADLSSLLDALASENSLLIFLTDEEANVLYSADEHAALYGKSRSGGSSQENPYRAGGQMDWQAGAFRNLPRGYADFLASLLAGEQNTVGYTAEDGTTYIYGAVLSGGRILYISTSLDAVGGTVGVLRSQLLCVTALSLVLGFWIAWVLSRQFARPVAALSAQAKHLTEADYPSGYEVGFCGELDDLSQALKETSARLQKLEDARRELLAGVSHDLRTPLTMIKGYAEMVKDISWSDEAQREADLTVIIREADRLTELVNDILEYSGLQSGQAAMTWASFDLSAAARSAAEQFSSLCAQRSIAVETDIAPGQWVSGDEKQLKRVLYNWLDNGIRHSAPGQTVRLALKPADGAVRAEVRDQGEGIPQEDLAHIWDRYFTSKERRGRDGAGLGLAISKEILQRHKARFGAESAPGQGSTFWFELESQP